MQIFNDEAPDIIELQVETIKGDRGERGKKGERGERGEKGQDGNHGLSIQGPQGPKGDKGDKGEQGEPGKDGKNGIDGKPGPEGRKGEKGDQGLPGKEPIIDFGEGKDFDRLKINGIVKGPHLSAKEAGRNKFVQYIGGENFWKKTANTLTPLNEPTLLDCSKMVQNIEGIQFDLVNDIPYSVGMLSWDATNKTAKLGLENGSELQIGQEQNFQGKNVEDITITDGSPVYIYSASGGVRNIKLAIASNYDISEKTIGLATQNISKNQFGYVTTFGLVNDVNTSAWSDGDTLWLSDTSGELSNTKPISNNIIRIGMVVYAHAINGKIFVNINHENRKFGDVNAGNYSEFEADGTLISHGNARCWKDENFSATLTAIGTGAPSLINWSTTSIKVPEFPSNQTKELNLLKEYDHAGVSPGSIVPHVHIHQTTNGTGTIKFYVEVIIKNGTTAPYINTISNSIAVDGTAWNEIRLDLPTITDTNIKTGAQIGMRLYRLSSDPGTYSGSVVVTTWGYHYEIDAFGSRTISAK